LALSSRPHPFREQEGSILFEEAKIVQQQNRSMEARYRRRVPVQSHQKSFEATARSSALGARQPPNIPSGNGPAML